MKLTGIALTLGIAFTAANAQAQVLTERNISMALEQLAKLGLRVVEQHVGGRSGIHIRFDTGAGQVVCRKHKAA